MSKLFKYLGVFLLGMYVAYAAQGMAYLWHILFIGVMFFSFGVVKEIEDVRESCK